jgi:predicted CXXCH cytochrome family protein
MKSGLAASIIAGLLIAARIPGGVAPSTDDEFGPPAMDAAPADRYHGGVIGGPHDFSDLTGMPGDSCSACHVPHVQGVRVVPPAPGEPGLPAVEMFRIAGQRRVFEPGRYMPGPTSLVCLGCHDGTVATSVIGTSHAFLSGVREGFAVPDGFVWRDHPIGVPYPRNNREYHPESFAVAKGIRLPEGRIECISCHDPHNEAGIRDLLVMSNRRSALCLTCHIK